MGAAVIISTYDDARMLDLCLAGLARQRVMPDEIAIGDDGSDDATRAMVDSWRDRLACTVVHVWHEDKGNRKGEISNKAVLKTRSDQLLFIDGDSIPHSSWVADHLSASIHGDVRCGRRVKLGPILSEKVLDELIAEERLESLLGPVFRSALQGDTKRFLLGVRLPYPIARVFHPRPRKLMGVNFSLSRAAFEAVNGYDVEWNQRRQDRDLDLRLNRAGLRYVALLNRAVVYHLYHEERRPSQEVEARVLEEGLSDRVRCRVGLTSDP
jgi:glycosyltransferase involved in cell wall biosynthesis